MKRKFATIILGLTLAVTSMGVSASEPVNSQNVQQEITAEKTLGTVRKIDGKTLFIALSEPDEIPAQDPEIVEEKKQQENFKNNANAENMEQENANLEENAEGVENIYLDFSENTENANVEINAEDTENKHVNFEGNTEKEDPEINAQDIQNENQDIENSDLTMVEVADDATIYSVPNTEDGNALMKECATQDIELPKLETLDISAIKEGNEICIWHDEEGKAVLLLVLDPDTETAAEQ